MATANSTTRRKKTRAERTALTERAVNALPAQASVYRRFDGLADPDLKGFGVTVAPSGTRSFFVAYVSPETGKRTQATIGVFPGVKLAAAREQARVWRRMIREGIDPTLEEQRQRESDQASKQAAAEARRAEDELGTVADLFDLYIRDLEMDGKRSAADVRKLFDRDIGPAIGGLKARDVTADHCADIIADVAARGAMRVAEHVRGYLVSAFNFGLRARQMPRWRRSAPRFDIDRNPAAGTAKVREFVPRGQRHLSREEVRLVWLALGEPYEVTGGHGARRPARVDVYTEIALKLLLATGQRVEEVLHASWSEFDREQRIWTIPAARRKNAAKNASGEPHLVPLADLHLELLEALEPFSGASGWLFPARVRPGDAEHPRDFRSLTQAVSRLHQRIGIEPFTPRDIRRTWKTLAGSIGIDLEIRNRVQGHAFDDVGSRNYDRYDYLDEKRTAMGRWTAFLSALLAENGTVVPFARVAGQ